MIDDLPHIGIKKRWALLLIVVFVAAYLSYNVSVIANCDGDIVRGMVNLICLKEGE